MLRWRKDRLLLVAGMLAAFCAGAEAAPDDSLVVETVLLNALTSSSLVETYRQTSQTKESILFRVGTASAYQTSSTILLGEQAPFTGFAAETKEGFREAAEDVMRRVKTRDDLTTPSFSDSRIQVYSNAERGAQHGSFWERPQVFGFLPPGYSASGEYALVHVGTTWSGNMHGMDIVFYLRRTQTGWTVLNRAEIRYV